MLGSLLNIHQDQPLQFRFGVYFLGSAVSSLIVPTFDVLNLDVLNLDVHFQKVSGLSTEVELQKVRSGGENLVEYSLPKKVTHDNLVLERGMVVLPSISLLNVYFAAAMSLFKFTPSNVLITLLSEQQIPLAAWLCINAYPVKWSVSDLDANSNGIMIDTMELAYTRLLAIPV